MLPPPSVLNLGGWKLMQKRGKWTLNLKRVVRDIEHLATWSSSSVRPQFLTAEQVKWKVMCCFGKANSQPAAHFCMAHAFLEASLPWPQLSSSINEKLAACCAGPHPTLHKWRGEVEDCSPVLSFSSEWGRGTLILFQIKTYCSYEELEMGLYVLALANKACGNLIHQYFNLWNHSSCFEKEGEELKVSQYH